MWWCDTRKLCTAVLYRYKTYTNVLYYTAYATPRQLKVDDTEKSVDSNNQKGKEGGNRGPTVPVENNNQE